MPHRARRALLSVTLFAWRHAVLSSVISQTGVSTPVRIRRLTSATACSALHRRLLQPSEQNYAEHLDQDKTDKAIYDGAIPGMLRIP